MRSLLILLILSFFLSPVVNAQSQSYVDIDYIIHYDPLVNEGVLEVSISLTPPSGLEPPYEATIPIHIFGEDAELFFLSYTVINLQTALAEYNETTGNFVIVFDRPGIVKIYFTIKDMLFSVDSIAHSLYLDTAVLEGIARNLKVELIMPGEYKIVNTTLRGETTVSLKIEDNTTHVLISGFGEITVDFYAEITELTETQRPSALGVHSIILIIVLVVIAITVSLIFIYYKRRKAGLEIETVDYTRDEVTKAILKLLKESGNKGLTQAELTKHTGLPKSSISRRIRRLEGEGFVEVKRVGKYNYLYLTNKGLELAKMILGKRGDE